MDLVQFIPEQLILLVISIYILGTACVKYPKLDNKYIPVVLLLMSILFSIWILGFNPTSILQGILCWGTAIGINQTIKQTTK